MRYLMVGILAVAAVGCTETQKPEKPKREGIIKKFTQEVVDAQVELQKDHIVEVVNEVKGNDPVSVSMSAYISATSQISTMMPQQRIAMFEVENNRYPTYDEFMQIVKAENIQFAMLPPYQMYGYDAEAGKIMVLEDTKDKAERYRRAGTDEEGNWAPREE
mgnify:CR=1 FL=1